MCYHIGAAGSFHGTYKGKATIRTAGQCILQARNDITVKIKIKNNHFNRRWGDANMSINVAADETFHGEGGTQAWHHEEPVLFTGKITGVNLEADIGSATCAMHLSLTKF